MKTNKTKIKNPSVNMEHPENLIEEYQAKFKVLFDNVSSGVAIYEARNDGEDFVFVDFNTAAEETEHIKKEELIGKSVLDVFPGVKEFGLFDVFQRVYKTGTPEHLPVSVYKDERIAGWRENYVFKLPSKQVVAIYDDVSVKKRTELVTRMTNECFRAIADYTYGWEVWVGPKGRVLWTNPAVLRTTGYSIKEITAMSDYPIPLIHEEDRNRMTKAFQKALEGGTGNDVQFRLERKDGKIIWATMSWQPIFDDKGNSLGHRQSIHDITALIEAEQALEKAEHEMEKEIRKLKALLDKHGIKE
ncbi:MAG: PAS domain-containing protein [Planctomycetota bacterium]|jgi:PAS domain S-box-containing protein